MMRGRRGTSFIDLIISIAIIAILFGGIYLVYFSLVTSIGNIGVRTEATSAVQAEIETIRNLPYESVGTVGGIPSGIIPQSQDVVFGNYDFSLATVVRNIDDPFDGTVSGEPPPVDTAPADYKLVEIDATCLSCTSAVKVDMTTTVAPKNLESAPVDGSLFVNALDANGNPVGQATVQVIDASVTPSVDLTDTTDNSGTLELVGVPTSTQSYEIIVSKPGYSTEETYPVGAPGNPNPVSPYATVAAQTVTSVTFAIDRLSTLAVAASNDRCDAVPDEAFSFAGSKLIGTGPNVLKFSTSSETGADGTVTFSSIEWDTYSFALNDASRDLEGTIPLEPLAVNPSSTADFRFVVASANDPSLLVTAADDATGIGLQNATVTISKAAFSETQHTGHSYVSQSDWSSDNYAAQSGGIDASVPGKITLLADASGTYPTGASSLESNTFDLGGASSSFYSLSWNPVAEPAATGLEFQVAANNDDATWNFAGPDGTGNTYFTASPASLPASLAGNRYVRYEAFLSTTDGSSTPELDDVALEFSADCVPPAQTLFTALPQGTYLVDVQAANYDEATTTVSVGTGETAQTITLTHS